MASFHDFGLQDFLLRPLEDGDVEHPTAVQEAVIPVLRRGGNLFARAGSGSGKTLAYTLGVFDRVRGSDDEDDGEAGTIRVLVLRPTTQAAERTALAMVPFAHAAGLGVVVPGGAWAMESAAADVIVASPADALAAVRGSGLKLDALEALVVDGASDILALGGRDAVESLLDHAPRDAQRVVLSAVTTSEVEDLVDRRVKRALRFPSEPAVTGGPAPAMEGSLGYTIVAEGEKTEMLIRLLRAPREGETPPVVFCRADERAADLAEALSVRGFVVGEADDAEADVAIVAVGTTREELAEESGDTAGRSISFDIPADEGALRQRHGGDPAALVFATPRELPHLQEIARRARLRAGAVVLPPPPGAGNRELDTFRQMLSTAVAEQDLGAQMLVLEPLFEAHGAAEVAAAAAALLRHRAPAAPAAATAPPVAAPAPGDEERTPVGPPPATFARLYVGVGSRDGVRPGDLVGAIAGEANIPGSRVGRIDIRDTFSVVEVHAEVAEQVVRAVNGTTLKGRSVRVDYDRGGKQRPEGRSGGRAGGRDGGGSRPGGPRPGGARRLVRPPPGDA